MTLNEIISIVSGSTSINSNKKIRKIQTDSRLVSKGDIFIALKGKKYDGNNYILDAINKGAIACICENNLCDKCICVKDTRKSLYLIANYIRKKYPIDLIAITGSNGKTTTKDLIYHVLSSKYNVLYNESNNNNIIGVSKTLFNLNKNHELCVIELGSNHIGEISEMSKMIEPNLSIITNIGTSHLEYFKNKKNIFKEKYSIISGMKEKKLIVNGDDRFLNKIKAYKCGFNKYNNLTFYDVVEYYDHIEFKVYTDTEYNIVFNYPGRHFIIDILLAIETALRYNISMDCIVSRIADFRMQNLRMNIKKFNSNIIVEDCYNSSFDSLNAGIEYLKTINERKVLILADMLELGKHSKRLHKKINKKLKLLKNKVIYTVGNYTKYIKSKHFNTVNDLLNYLSSINIEDSYIYIKGSRKYKLEIITSILNK